MVPRKQLFYSITALGISSIITQIILSREFLTIFYGNELVLGIILANWLMLTGIGAYLAKHADKIKDKLRFLVISQITIAILPIIDIIAIRMLRNVLFPVGSLINITGIFLTSLAVLAPYCLISGFLLTLFCVIYPKRKNEESIGKVYFIDSIGDIAGGFLFSFILVFILDHVAIAFIIMFLNLIAAYLIAEASKKKTLMIVILCLFIAGLGLSFFNIDRMSVSYLYPDQQLVYAQNSPFGNVVVTRTAEQLNFYQDGVNFFSTGNIKENEEVVHYAMSQSPNPKTVLLIGGGVSGTTDEILKYDVDRIDYVELDPEIINLGRRFTSSLDDERIHTINTDARLFVKQTSERYDVVIIDLPDPDNAQINRFYTTEFFSLLKKRLNQGGIVSLSLISTENYINEEEKALNSVIYNTLHTQFANILIIPGERNYFLASDSMLTMNLSGAIEARNITNRYVNPDYLKGDITLGRINYIMENIDPSESVNWDFSPISYYYHLLYWMKHFKANYITFIALISLLILYFVLKMDSVSFAIFTSGFAASSLEVVILIGLQIIYGYVYQMIGVIVTMFMLGLALGSYYMNRNVKKMGIADFIRLEYAIAAYSIILPFILILLSKVSINSFISRAILSLLMIIIAVLVGMEFPLAAKINFRKTSHTASSLYNADLIGAALGALLVSALLIPIQGLIWVCMMVALLNVFSGILVYYRRSKNG